MRKFIVVCSAVIILTVLNFNIYAKQKIIRTGRVVYLELLSFDPHAFMQGDYLKMNFKFMQDAFQQTSSQKLHHTGKIVLGIDEKGIGHFRRLDGETALSQDEILIRYKIKNGIPQLDADAFFLEADTGNKYRQARFGEFRIAQNGQAMLVNLCDSNRNIIK